MKRLLTTALFALSSTVFAATLNPVQLINPAGSTAGQAIVSTGASTAPAWGSVTAGGLAAQAANTVVANVTGSSASPTAVAMPSCSASGNNLQWTSGAGFTCATGYAQLASPTFTGTVTIPGGAITNTSISGSTGSFTTLAASSTVSGAGFSTYLASPPAIGTTAAAAGKFTTLAATGAITPSGTAGIVGTPTNDNANAGSVGEYVTATLASGSAVPLTNNIAANVVSISLTAGDWDVSGVVAFAPAGSTVLSNMQGSISSASATLGTPLTGGAFFFNFTNTGIGSYIPTGVVRMSLTGTTTVFLVASAGFTTSTCGAYGAIRARRAR